MANEEKSKGSWSIAQIVGIVGVIGALSSLGNFGLNLLDLGEGSVSQLPCPKSLFRLTYFHLFSSALWLSPRTRHGLF